VDTTNLPEGISCVVVVVVLKAKETNTALLSDRIQLSLSSSDTAPDDTLRVTGAI